MARDFDTDFAIVGSGFGGSVSARCASPRRATASLVLEKGKRFAPEDFPKTNWNLRRWLWLPGLGFRGLFQMTFLKHVTALSGVGVGGGSLVYANTLPVPEDGVLRRAVVGVVSRTGSSELAPHYATAQRMLGATRVPVHVAAGRGAARRGDATSAAGRVRTPRDVAVYFGEPGETVPDPYFGGEGPERTGCTPAAPA